MSKNSSKNSLDEAKEEQEEKKFLLIIIISFSIYFISMAIPIIDILTDNKISSFFKQKE